ncbi:MAG TPA: hypothetical protein VFN61_06820 [Acidimicrobiales bacterium]|nr:hypothetical protein [Acidimicrobiales bacterium]
MDSKLYGQLVHRGASLVVLDQAGHLGVVEPLGPFWYPSGPFGRRS